MEMLGLRLPEEQKRKVEELAEKESYPNVSEYVRELIRKDLRERKELKKELLEEIKERKEEVDSGKVGLDDMRTMEQIAEEEGLKD